LNNLNLFNILKKTFKLKVQLRKPFFPQRSIDRIEKKIGKILKLGWLTLGDNLKLFESTYAKFQGAKYSVGVSSATAGLHLSLLSVNVSKGDEVIVPPKTFISTANAALYCNATPIFCDVDEETFQLDPLKLKKLISKNTKAVIPVHLGGNICQMEEINEISQKYNLTVIEDAAHAHGSTLKGKKAGSFGALGIFSFYPDKIMASSDGGIITTNSKDLYEKLLLLRNVGRISSGNWDFRLIGYNYRMNEIQAIIANEQLQYLPKMIKMRRKIAATYDSKLEGVKNLKKQKILPHIKSSYYAYGMRSMKGDLKILRKKLLKVGIETSPMFTSIYNTKPYVDLFGKRKGLCPISEKLDNQTFTIPLHPGLRDEEVDFVVNNLKILQKTS